MQSAFYLLKQIPETENTFILAQKILHVIISVVQHLTIYLYF